ncbi:hypothetical protein ON010_g18469 [Phytophthora cinnamomi]|nr:hypothetical protein ON010_g18469 [Phytophthora cinnamomi]
MRGFAARRALALALALALGLVPVAAAPRAEAVGQHPRAARVGAQQAVHARGARAHEGRRLARPKLFFARKRECRGVATYVEVPAAAWTSGGARGRCRASSPLSEIEKHTQQG